MFKPDKKLSKQTQYAKVYQGVNEPTSESGDENRQKKSLGKETDQTEDTRTRHIINHGWINIQFRDC